MGAYDYRNRLTSITTTGPTPTDGSTQTQNTAIYTYDVDNDRIGREVIDQADDATPTLEEAYAYDNGQMSLVIDPTASSGNTMGPTVPVTYSVAERIMETPNDASHPIADVNAQTGAVTWLLCDQQGSIRDSVTNGSNYHVDFDSYGDVIGTNQPKRFGFTGQEQDAESGLVYMNARYYDPTTGTFISQDPTGFSSGDSNLYRYTGNSPTNATDPTGDNSIWDDWFGIDKDKTFGIPNKTFLGSALHSAIGLPKALTNFSGDGFYGDWNGMAADASNIGYYGTGAGLVPANQDNTLGISNRTFFGSALDGPMEANRGLFDSIQYGSEFNWNKSNAGAFNFAYYASGPGYLTVENTPIHSAGLDLGWINGSLSYDPGTGLRSISFGFEGAEIEQSMDRAGDIDTMLGAHYGFGLIGGLSAGVSAMVDVDHPDNSYVGGSLSYAGVYAGVQETVDNRFNGSFGFGIPALADKSGAGVSVGWGWTIDSDGNIRSSGGSLDGTYTPPDPNEAKQWRPWLYHDFGGSGAGIFNNSFVNAAQGLAGILGGALVETNFATGSVNSPLFSDAYKTLQGSAYFASLIPGALENSTIRTVQEGVQLFGGLLTGQESPSVVLRGLLGIPATILTGDAFDKYAYDQVSVTPGKNSMGDFVNGIATDTETSDSYKNSIQSFPDMSGTISDLYNGTHGRLSTDDLGIGDLLEIAFNEFGLITGTDIRLANEIKMQYQALKDAGVQNPMLNVVAHSQGAMGLDRALDVIAGMDGGSDILAALNVYTNGGERFISNQRGLNSVFNFVTDDDPVPRLGNGGLLMRIEDVLRGGGQTYNITSIGPGSALPLGDSWSGHHWFATPGQNDPSVHYGNIYASPSSLQFYENLPSMTLDEFLNTSAARTVQNNDGYPINKSER